MNTEWKPIASAPKDGTRVLLWNEKFTAPCSGQFYGFDDWKIDSDIPPFAFQPTHWMPLPPAPTSHPIPTGATGEDESQPDLCPRCDGSGEITVMSDSSPDAHDVNVCCDHCQGSGAAVDAAKYLAAALAGEKFRHSQLYWEFRNFHRILCARFGYGHDPVHFRRDLVSLEEAIAAKVGAPAAGDALDALRELVACDNIKKQIASMQVCVLETDDDVQELDGLMSDLARRQPAAWDAARAAIAQQSQRKEA